MKNTVKFIAVAAVLTSALAYAQNRTAPQARKGSAETTLIGISLYDSGQKVIAKYGSPQQIMGLSLGSGGGGAASGGGRGGPTGGASAPAVGGRAGNTAPGVGADVVGDPFDTGKTMWQQLAQNPNFGGKDDENDARGGSIPSGGGGSRGAGGTTQGNSSLVQFTRWVYTKGSSKYAFVLDKFNRVVQIEAFGLWDTRVKTRRGAKFGTSFGTLINKYNAPDGYELNGDTIVMRYLNRDNVAFRLQKTDPKKGHMVTGIVVAAG